MHRSEGTPGGCAVLPADDAESWARAGAALSDGGVVGLPTDTVYGLVARLDATPALFTVKGRDRSNPVAVLVADLDQALEVAALDEDDRTMARRWWPGALTIVAPVAAGLARCAGLAADDDVAAVLGGDGRTIGVRSPADPRLRVLLQRTGPLAATSANLAGRPALTLAAEIALLPGVRLVVDGGERIGPPSTVVRGSEVLRRGAVDPSAPR